LENKVHFLGNLNNEEMVETDSSKNPNHGFHAGRDAHGDR
jgi:hypothetical protein